MTYARSAVACSALALTATLLAGCGSSDEPSTVAADCEPVAQVETIEDGVLTVAIAEFPPYIGADGNTPTGIDGALITKIAQDLCLDLKVNLTSFPAITSALQNGTADLSAGSWTITADRQEMFEVSEPVYKSLAGVVSPDGISTVDEMEGLSVGTTTGYLWVEDLQNAIGGDNVKLYQSEQAVYDDLEAGRIDAGLFTEGAVAFYMESDGNPEGLKLEVLEADPRIEMTVNEPTTGVLIRKGSTDLLDAVNQVIADYQSSGELADQLEQAGISEQSLITN